MSNSAEYIQCNPTLQIGGVGQLPGGWTSFGTIPTPPDWRTSIKDDNIELSTDMPGVRSSDLSLEFRDNVLTAIAYRYDLSSRFSKTHFVNNFVYDFSTARATLVDGVLTVKIKKVEQKLPPVKIPLITE